MLTSFREDGDGWAPPGSRGVAQGGQEERMERSGPGALPCPPPPLASCLTGSHSPQGACMRDLRKGLRTLGWSPAAADSPLHQLSFSSVLLPEAIHIRCSNVPSPPAHPLPAGWRPLPTLHPPHLHFMPAWP